MLRHRLLQLTRNSITLTRNYQPHRPLQSTTMTAEQSSAGDKAGSGAPTGDEQHQSAQSRRPKKLIFAPGDIEATTDLKITATETSDPSAPQSQSSAASPLASHLAAERIRSDTSTPTSAMETQMLSHPARAHQFVTNPPLTISQMHPTNPLHQFHSWFRDPRLPASSAPETCTLATASMPSGRVSARVVYLKELDERGWVVYSNWGSREGKGGQVFGGRADGTEGLESMPEPGEEATDKGNKWAALTFVWSTVERQVRIEGLIEPLSREESEMYWRTRERGSQIGAWASWQSKVLWSAEPGSLVGSRRKSQVDQESAAAGTHVPADIDETDMDDGRAILEQRVQEMEARFADTEEIPLPPFWGGARLVPESVEFWQGRRSRLHDRFKYVRVPEDGESRRAPRKEGESDPLFKWRIERLSP